MSHTSINAIAIDRVYQIWRDDDGVIWFRHTTENCKFIAKAIIIVITVVYVLYYVIIQGQCEAIYQLGSCGGMDIGRWTNSNYVLSSCNYGWVAQRSCYYSCCTMRDARDENRISCIVQRTPLPMEFYSKFSTFIRTVHLALSLRKTEVRRPLCVCVSVYLFISTANAARTFLYSVHCRCCVEYKPSRNMRMLNWLR